MKINKILNNCFVLALLVNIGMAHASEFNVGYTYSMAVVDGVVYGSGYNDKGQLAGQTEEEYKSKLFTDIGVHNVKKVFPSYKTTFYISIDGSVGYTGFDYGMRESLFEPRLVPSTGTEITDIAIGIYTSDILMLDSNGDVYYWDYINAPEVIMSDVKAVDAGFNFYAAITNHNELYTWGDDTYHQLGNGDSGSSSTPELILTNVKATSMTAFSKFGVAQLINGDMYTWGTNGSYNSLGTGSASDENSPVKIDSPIFTEFHASGNGVIGLTSDGLVYGWGFHNLIGDGHYNHSSVPKELTELSGQVKQLKAGNDSFLYENFDNQLCGWSSNAYGELGLGLNSKVELHEPSCSNFSLKSTNTSSCSIDDSESYSKGFEYGSIEGQSIGYDNGYQVGYNKAFELGKQFCIDNPESCGIHQEESDEKEDDTDNNKDESKNISEKIEICHKNKKTKHVPETALQGHLNHGDILGSCK